jgi:glycosyltransferase involved in cell wall biosynthesis
MKGKLAAIRDRINLYYHSLPDEFIAISNSGKNMLVQQGVRSKISVVYCGPELQLCKLQDRSESRRKYGINDKDYVVGLIGRIQFLHKGHDFLIDSISKYLNKLENIKLIIVGDGPDENILKSLINSKGLNKLVTLVPWSNDLSYIYSAIDMLVIPSRFEGLPLVMLEAMYYSLPIVASNVDGMAEVLPKEWLFQFCDSHSLIETMLRVKHKDNTKILSNNKSRILTEFNYNRFGENFYKAITG